MDEDLDSMVLADKFTLTFLFLSNHCSGICSCNHISCTSLCRPPISKIAKSELAAVLRKKRRSILSASTRAEWPVPAYSVPYCFGCRSALTKSDVNTYCTLMAIFPC